LNVLPEILSWTSWESLLCPPQTHVVDIYWFHRNSIFLWISTNISIGRRFWSNGPMDWLQICWLCWSYSNLGLKETNFRDFKDFDDFEAVFHQIFTKSRYLGFTKSPNRYLRACIECVETPGFQIPTGRLFCIMHALLLSMNWFRSNVGGMLLILWNSLIWIWILC
jgi:hypothetical protein